MSKRVHGYVLISLLVLAMIVAGCTTGGTPVVDATPVGAGATTGATGAGSTPGAGATDTTGAGMSGTSTPDAGGAATTTAGMATPASGGATAEATGTSGTTGTPEAAATGTTGMAGTPENLPATGEVDVPEVTFVGTEYEYAGPDSVPGGWTQMTFDNQGKQPHEMWIAQLLEEKTLEDIMAAFQADGPPEWLSLYASVSADPGEQGSVIVNLEPGNYMLFSMASGDENSPPDAVQGMTKMFTVTESTGTGDVTLPEPAAKIGLVDYAFVVNEETLPAGENIFLLENTGKEMHEIVFQTLKEGATMDDVRAALEAEMSGTPTPEEDMPVTGFGGFALLSPGKQVYQTFDLEPGKYVLICHIPSPANEGRPHYDLGMIRMITVE